MQRFSDGHIKRTGRLKNHSGHILQAQTVIFPCRLNYRHKKFTLHKPDLVPPDKTHTETGRLKTPMPL